MAHEDGTQELTHVRTLRGMRAWQLSSALAAVYSAVTTGAYSTGFALYLGASNSLIGLLSAAPSWGQLLQFVSPVLIERLKQRKPLCLLAYTIGYAMWLPIALIPFLLWGPFRPWAMILLVALSGLCLALAQPASTSWLTDLVPPEARARFVSRQQSIVAGVGLAASLAAGRYLDAFPPAWRGVAFLSLFVIAVLFAISAIFAWARVPEPPKAVSETGPVLEFLALPFRNRNFLSLTLFIASRTMAVMIAAPFFMVFMLKQLGLPYAQVAIFSALATIAMMATNPLWGYLAGKFGYRPIFQMGAGGLCIVPLVWVFVTPGNHWFVISAVQVWAGVMSAGVILGQFNLVIKMAPSENRSVYLGAHSAIVNAAVMLGSMLGGVLADLFARSGPFELFHRPLSNLQCVFLVSSTLRFISLFLVRRISEDRAVHVREVLAQVRSGSPLTAFWNLARMARSSDASSKVQAAKALGTTRSKLAVEELIVLLDDTDREARREAARALGEIGDERAIEPLIEKVRDPLADIVEEAIEALGKIPARESLASLMEVLDDGRPSVRKAAALALGNLGDPRGRGRLEELLERELDSTVFLAAAEALSRIAGTSALHRLRTLLRSSRSGVARKELANSIGNILGPSGAFYRLLQAEPMQQEEMVERVLVGSRRLLSGRLVTAPDCRETIGRALERAMHCFEQQDYAGAVTGMHRAASRATRSFAGSDRCAACLSAAHPGYHADLRVERKVGLLLETSPRLRLSYGFLAGLHADSHHRSLHLEEGLLGAFALRQVVDELTVLARQPNGKAGRG
jgi:MFS family permease